MSGGRLLYDGVQVAALQCITVYGSQYFANYEMLDPELAQQHGQESEHWSVVQDAAPGQACGLSVPPVFVSDCEIILTVVAS